MESGAAEAETGIDEGTSVGNGSAATIAVENPASGETIATVPSLRSDDVAAMAADGRAAQPAWEALGFEGRGRVLMAAKGWLVANAERVVTTLCGETGRPADEVQLTDLGYGIGALEFWAKAAPKYLADEQVETASPAVRGGRRMEVRYAALGLVGVIGPWNFPLTNSFGDCIPALAAGNSVILKPSEITPLTSLLMAEMLADAGIPDGVFQVATGAGETGAALVDEVDFVMFTGSTATGKKVMGKAAESLTPVSLELGGKDPMIVLCDADIERAVNAAVTYGLNNSGQVCISVERIYVEDAVHDEFVSKLTERVAAVRQGPPGPIGTVDVGAIIFPPQIELIEAHVEDAVASGAQLVSGGKRGAGPGRFYEPTVLTGVDHSMRCMQEETFGPTLPVMRVADAEQALELANDGPYGLQASVWTRDLDKGRELARRVEAGAVCVNDAQLNYSVMELPMGGWKESGLGTRHGAGGIRKYTRTQSVLIAPGYAPERELHYFPYNAVVTQAVGETMAALAMSELFDDAQRRTLNAFCDTLIPSLDPPEGEPDPTGFWERCAADMAIAEACEVGLLGAEPSEDEVAGLRALLDGLAEHGMSPEATQEEREQIIDAVADSGPEGLAGITTLRSIALSAYYALPDLGTGINPNWPAMGYPGPQALPKEPGSVERPIKPIVPEGSALTLEADVAVIGSGAGGGVIAAELAAAGKKVCVLEMGGYYDETQFTGLELSGYQQLYLNGGPFPTAEGQVSIQAGSSLGGGTVLNWTNCLRTHAWVREEWASEFGLEGLDGPEYDSHMDAIWERLGVTDQCSDLNGPHQRLKAGCEARGLDFRTITRNTDPATYDPVTAGYMGYGDQSGSKRSTQKTFLADAATAEVPADFLVRCRAERILVEGGRAVGVEAVYDDPDDPATAPAKVTVRAPQVVVACGAIESPGLLLRSGIGGPAVGNYLRVHPTSAIFAVYEEPQDAWWGPPQAGLSHHFENVRDGYGFLLECAHHTTGLYGAATTWRGGRDHKENILKYRYGAGAINLTRDRGHGRVTLDARGRAVPSYLLTDELDVEHMRMGLEQMARVHEAAGAAEIGPLTRHVETWHRGDDLERLVGDLQTTSLAPRELGIFSAHQMGTCRMGTDPETSVAKPDGELHDTEGVWIGDASAFPTASGTNPMFTIMSLARRTARQILSA